MGGKQLNGSRGLGFTRSQYLVYALIVLALSGVLELVYKAAFCDHIPALTFYGSIIGVLFLPMIASIIPKSGNSDEEKSPTGEDGVTAAKNGLWLLIGQIRNNRIRWCVCLISITGILVSTTSYYGVCGKLIRNGQNVVQVLIETPYIQEHQEVSSTPPVSEMESPEAPPPVQATPEPTPMEPPSFELKDPGRNYTLDQQMFNTVYFLDGPYVISDWENSAEIEAAVLRCVQDYVALDCSNQFDEYAPISVQREVVWASELERRLSNSEELEQIISVRKSAFSEYPKYSLARMIAESYNKFGLEYLNIGGNFSTIEYYYGNSICWLLTTLSYSGGDTDTIRSLLSSLQMRYHDIWSVAPQGSDSAYYAQRLYEAFKAVRAGY